MPDTDTDPAAADLASFDTFNVPSSGAISAHFIQNFCLGATRTTFDKPTQNLAAKLYALAMALPDLPAGVLLDIAAGKYEITYAGEGRECVATYTRRAS